MLGWLGESNGSALKVAQHTGTSKPSSQPDKLRPISACRPVDQIYRSPIIVNIQRCEDVI